MVADGFYEWRKADVLVVGNTHWPMIARAGRSLIMNPGSLGEPRTPANPYKRTYALLDTLTRRVEIRGVVQLF